MALSPDEVRDLVPYQVGALVGFLSAERLVLDHLKPNGSLYGMVGRDPALMDALCDVAVQYAVPVYGLARPRRHCCCSSSAQPGTAAAGST